MLMLFKKKARVIFDTNFLMLPGSKALDVFSGVEQVMDEPFRMCIMQHSLDELQQLLKGKRKDSFNAKLGFILAKQKGLKALSSSQRLADDAIVDVTDDRTYVATLDRDLQKRVKNKGGRIISVRQNQVILQPK